MDTAPRQQVATAAPREQGRRQALHVGTVAWLTFAREKHPELSRRERLARLDLAAAIIAMDTVENRIAAGEQLHSMNEQTAVEETKNAYAQAVADLVRGQVD